VQQLGTHLYRLILGRYQVRDCDVLPSAAAPT
jgi:hypothetical protein